MFFIMGAIGLTLFSGYMGWHITPLFQKRFQKKRVVWALSIAVYLVFIGVALFTRGVLIGFLFCLIIFFVLFDIARITYKLFPRARAAYDKVYRNGLVPAALGVVMGVAGMLNFHSTVVTHYAFDAARHTGAALRVAMASDIHLGSIVDENRAREILALIAEQEPDIVLLGGDIFVEESRDEQIEAVLGALKEITPPFGIYYVPGNHEYYAQGELVDRLEEPLKQAGVTLLRDDALLINDSFYLIGREEFRRARQPLEALMGGLSPDYPVIVLDHQPKDLALGPVLGVDLQLSGHTHAGQLFPFGVFAELMGMNEMNYGMRTVGEYHIIVSSGAGGWGFPMRIGSPSEVVLVEIS